MRLLPLLLTVACAAGTSGLSRLERVPNGEWGGEHVRLTVADTGGKVEFDCGHGTLDGPLALDTDGRFDVTGTLVAEGGPVRKDEAASARAVRYRGRTNGKSMTLEVTLEGGDSAGTFSLTRSGRAKLVKCR
jgi:hypothetical protein